MVESIVWSVSEWVAKRKEFLGVYLEDLSRSWPVFFQGGRQVTFVKKTPWTPPPNGVFKLNFDAIFLHSSQRGGIGGVIRDWKGTVLRNFLGPVDSLSANDAEVFALLIGCRELLTLESINAVIEGDS